MGTGRGVAWVEGKGGVGGQLWNQEEEGQGWCAESRAYPV